MITDAASGDTLIFGVTGTITLTSGELLLVKSLNIIGPEAGNLTISGNHASRLLKVQSNVVASLSGLNLRDGKASNGVVGTVVEGQGTPGGPGQAGGAIYTAGTLTLNDCRVISNAAGQGGHGIGNDVYMVITAGGNGGSGGAIYNIGTMYLSNCVVSGNAAGNGGVSGALTFSPISGAGGEGGGIYNAGTLWLDHSMVSGNVAGSGGDTPREARGGHGGAGGGIWNSGIFAAIRSTISDNVAGDGGHGGVDSLDGGDGGNGGNGGGVFSSGGLALTNCTVRGNFPGSGGAGGVGVLGENGNHGRAGRGRDIYVVGRNSILVNCGVIFAAFQDDTSSSQWGLVLVTSCDEQSLREALAASYQVTFTCDGTIALTNTIAITNNSVLDGGGHQVTISGAETVRAFYVHSNASLTLMNLTVANGFSTNGGAAIWNEGGQVNLFDCLFSENSVQGSGGRFGVVPPEPGRDAYGGAIYSSGNLKAFACTFRRNSVVGGAGGSTGLPEPYPGTSGGLGYGGAVYSTGTLQASTCTFVENSATGGLGGGAGPDEAGYYTPQGVPGGIGGAARGGAICNAGVLIIEGSAVVGNIAEGGQGGQGGFCGGISGGTGGIGGAGGSARGSALGNEGAVAWANCTIVSNYCLGGKGGSGAPGGPSGAPLYNGGQGGDGGFGGSAVGAVWDDASRLSMTNCTVAFNSGSGGPGGLGGPAGEGAHPGRSGDDGTKGLALGSIATLGGVLKNTLLANNIPTNSTGFISDAGHNLSSDDSCTFTNLGSLNHTDPKLGPLANNGGPTLTMSLLPGSPAIDAGDSAAAPPTDQRGVPRPYGAAADIGAYEYWLTAKASASPGGGVDILACGISGQECCLQVSTNLTNWTTTATNEISADGTAGFHDDTPGQSLRFYRLMLR
ncbi:MAG: hypothetical protein KIS67_14330 [Verrucomicrobiae bacterium]|nr:hypothetical protein [Verrucomicrobiae bacterium]